MPESGSIKLMSTLLSDIMFVHYMAWANLYIINDQRYFKVDVI